MRKKFSEGDKVVVVNALGAEYRNGDIGVVNVVVSSAVCLIDFKNGQNNIIVHKAEIELVPEKDPGPALTPYKQGNII
jgi:hypothetical protein